MSTLRLAWMTHPPQTYTGGVLTIGNFDGVHLGHRQLIQATNELATMLHGPSVLVTFDPAPLTVLQPQLRKPPLTTFSERAASLHQMGIDHVVGLQTDPGLLSLTPEAFFEDVILGLFQARGLVEGYNFRFGRGREGDTKILRRLCELHGVQFQEIQPWHADDGELISSSLIRDALTRGDVLAAKRWLGRPYAIRGIVETGAQRGRTIGFPTANLGQIDTMIPQAGVYGVRVSTPQGVYLGAANIGPNPTFGEQQPKFEVHVLDFAGDLYGTELTVVFMERLRDVQTFPNVQDLIQQLELDVQQVRNLIPNS